MERELLKNFVDLNLSTRQIAKENGVSQATIKHWLKKFDLKTNHLVGGKKEYGEEKFCPKCEKQCSINDFYNKGKKLNGYGWCKACLNTYTVEKQRKLKIMCIEYKGGKCFICGYNSFAGALDFHHLDPKTKDFNISRVKNKKFDSIKNELDKCVLLCSNCHREVEGGFTMVGPVGFEPTTYGLFLPSY